MAEALKKVGKAVFYSGTLYPERYIRLFRLKHLGGVETQDRYVSPFPKENRLDIFYSKYRVDAEARSKRRVIKKVSKDLFKISEVAPRVMCIVAVKPLFDALKPHLGLKVYEEPLGIPQPMRVGIVSEMSGSERTSITPYGALAKSIDLPFIRTMVVVGLPVAKMSLERRMLANLVKRRFMAEGMSLRDAELASFKLTHIYPAIERAVQAVGRFQRSEDDRGVVVWMDERWVKYKGSIKPLKSVTYTGLGKVVKKIKAFFI